VRLRHELGLLAKSFDEEMAEAEESLAAWVRLLEGRGLLRPGAGPEEVVEALHRLIAQTPARLLCVSLADAVGDKRAQNQPGTDQEYPNWRVPLTDGAGEPVLIEDLPTDALLRRIVATITG
jgi:4-alpha-glucanotransferase